jgi:nonsense-mediated mRNA decay protein 3
MVEILWHREQCDRCNRISGSYYEGIVQVRAEGRTPSSFEIQTSASIAQQIEDNLQAGGERLSFISDMNEIHDGIDIIIGSQHIGLLIAQGIVAQLGGRYTTHPKLVGEKNGRQLFRVTYSVRLPRFQKNDVIRIRNRYYEVQRVESHHLQTIDLRDGTARSVREDDAEKIIGNSRNAETALVVFADGKNMGVMDPESSQTHDYPQPRWLEVRTGDHIRLLRDGSQMVFVR